MHIKLMCISVILLWATTSSQQITNSSKFDFLLFLSYPHDENDILGVDYGR